MEYKYSKNVIEETLSKTKIKISPYEVLEAYIRKCLNNGIDKKSIILSLGNRGWKDIEILKGFEITEKELAEEKELLIEIEKISVLQRRIGKEKAREAIIRKLEDYIKSKLSRGRSKEDVKEELLGLGFNLRIITELIKSLGGYSK